MIITISLRNKAPIFKFTYILILKPGFHVGIIILGIVRHVLAKVIFLPSTLICSFVLSQPLSDAVANIFHLYFLLIISFFLGNWRKP